MQSKLESSKENFPNSESPTEVQQVKSEKLVDVSGLSVAYRSKQGDVRALDGVDLSIGRNKLVAVVGESGCGKSTLALSIIGLLSMPPAHITGGKILYKGTNLLELSKSEMLYYRGTEIAMIFQEPLSSLNPVYKVGDQVAEAIAIRESRSKGFPSKVFSYEKPMISSPLRRMLTPRLRVNMSKELRNEVVDILRLVRIPDPEQVIDRYPFELSGGMRQRVMIAMALSEKPSLLIADEPTSFIDVTTQAQVLKLMKNLMDEVNTSILLVTHDLAVASQVADEVFVMYAANVVESADVYELFSKPLHPYTRGLLSCIPYGFKDQVELKAIPGNVPDLRSTPKGCVFAPRCPHAKATCHERKPDSKKITNSHSVACFLYE